MPWPRRSTATSSTSSTATPGTTSPSSSCACPRPQPRSRNPPPASAVGTVVHTLVARIERALDRPTAVTFLQGTDPPERVLWARLYDDAVVMAAGLQARGVGPGTHVALLGPTSRAFVTAIEATWLAGATLIVLPLPMRLGSLDEFVAQTRARMRGADAALVVVDP